MISQDDLQSKYKNLTDKLFDETIGMVRGNGRTVGGGMSQNLQDENCIIKSLLKDYPELARIEVREIDEQGNGINIKWDYDLVGKFHKKIWFPVKTIAVPANKIVWTGVKHHRQFKRNWYEVINIIYVKS